MTQDVQPDPLWEDLKTRLVSCHPVTWKILLVLIWKARSFQAGQPASLIDLQVVTSFSTLLAQADDRERIRGELQMFERHPWVTRTR